MKNIKMLIMLCLSLLVVPDLYAEGDNGVRVQYKVGDGLYLGDGSNLVHFQGRFQGRYTYLKLEDAPAPAAGRPDTSTFSVARGEYRIDGHVLDKLIRFGFESSFSTPSGTAANVTLNDFYVDFVPYSFFGVKIGQFKVPYLMQELTSSMKLQFVDRAATTAFFNFSRDIGMSFHGDFLDKKANYSIFFMNGDGRNTVDTNQGLMMGARLEYSILGKYENVEADVNQSEEPNLGFGLAYLYDVRGSNFQNGLIVAGDPMSNGTFDAGLKYKGFSAQGAFMLTRGHENTSELTNLGYLVQTGYFVVPKKFEVAAKAGGAIFSDAVVNQYEYALGLNYYLRGHGIKFNTDYTYLLNRGGANLNDHQFRAQAQVVF